MEDYQIAQKIRIDFLDTEIPLVHIVQNDCGIRVLQIELYAGGVEYKPPAGCTANIYMYKPDGTKIYNPADQLTGNLASFTVTPQMAAVPGMIPAQVEVLKGASCIKNARFNVRCWPAVVPPDAIESTDEYKSIQQLAGQVQDSAAAAAQSEKNAKAQADAAKSQADAAKTSAAAAAGDAAKATNAGTDADAAAKLATEKATAAGTAEAGATAAAAEAKQHAADAAKAKADAEAAAKTAGDAATKVIEEGVAEKLAQMQEIERQTGQNASAAQTAAATAVQAGSDAQKAATLAGQKAEEAAAAKGGADTAAAAAQKSAEAAEKYAAQAAGDRLLSFFIDPADGGLNVSIAD